MEQSTKAKRQTKLKKKKDEDKIRTEGSILKPKTKQDKNM